MDCTLDSLFLATILPSDAFERSAVIPSTENSSAGIRHLLGSRDTSKPRISNNSWKHSWELTANASTSTCG
eukprot:6307340-Amphidinium_carterae.1